MNTYQNHHGRNFKPVIALQPMNCQWDKVTNWCPQCGSSTTTWFALPVPSSGRSNPWKQPHVLGRAGHQTWLAGNMHHWHRWFSHETHTEGFWDKIQPCLMTPFWVVGLYEIIIIHWRSRSSTSVSVDFMVIWSDLLEFNGDLIVIFNPDVFFGDLCVERRK